MRHRDGVWDEPEHQHLGRHLSPWGGTQYEPGEEELRINKKGPELHFLFPEVFLSLFRLSRECWLVQLEVVLLLMNMVWILHS